MADINVLKTKFFVQAADANPPSEPVPAEFQNSLVTPLIDCERYNNELLAALALVGTGTDAVANAGHFIYIANWWLGLSGGEYVPAAGNFVQDLLGSAGPSVVDLAPYYLDADQVPPDPDATESLLEILKAKARVGVDVRVLGWVSFSVMDSVFAQKNGAETYARINALTMQSIQDLRDEPEIGAKALLNIISHTAGAAHSKLVVLGTNAEAIGFTGGIDFAADRWSRPGHPLEQTWHDAVAKVEGPAVQGLFDWFAQMWQENLARPVRRFRFGTGQFESALPRPPALDPRVLPVAPKGNHHVQSVRTVPAFKYQWYNCLPENPPISFAPQGLFEFRTAVRKALKNAERYVYIEDEFFWSQELLGWINEAIQTPRPNLRVILVTGGGTDPNDPKFGDALLCNSINHGLLEGLTAAQRNQVRMFRRRGDRIKLRGSSVATVTGNGATSDITLSMTPNTDIAPNVLRKEKMWIIRQGGNDFVVDSHPAAPKNQPLALTVKNPAGGALLVAGTCDIVEWKGVFVHSKVILVDDLWMMIGSSSAIRRSLYSDLEHSVSVLDPNEQLVKDFRKSLWADQFQHGSPADFDDLDEALHAWEPTWGTAGAAPTLPDVLEPTVLPITPDEPLQGKVKDRYDWYTDIDSRDAWGGLCPP
jgi:phosphatidylserine/phosphatidylglycerophosphate/cardiolipin synthase-like enzyme